MSAPVAIRETIMQGIFDRIRTSCGSTFAFYSRKFITWVDLGQMITTPAPDRDPRQMPRAQAGIDAQRRCGIDQNGGSIRVWYGKITRAVSGRKGTRIA